MPESSLNDVLLPALRGEDVGDAEARLLEADPSGAEAALLHLVRIAAVEASATSVAVDDLLDDEGRGGARKYRQVVDQLDGMRVAVLRLAERVHPYDPAVADVFGLMPKIQEEAR